MTDYQPLLARALKGLDRNTSEARRAVYDRARQALLNQLRSVSPPMADADITRERLALEDAIRKTETEAVLAEPHAVRAPAARMPMTPRIPRAAPSAAPAAQPPSIRPPMQPRIPMPPQSPQSSNVPPPGASAPRPPLPRARPAMPGNSLRPDREFHAETSPPPRKPMAPAPMIRDPMTRAPRGEFPPDIEPSPLSPPARRLDRPRPPVPNEFDRGEVARNELRDDFRDDFPPVPPPPPSPGPRPRAARPPGPGPVPVPAMGAKAPPAKSGRSRIVVVSLAALLIAGAGVLAYTFRGRLSASITPAVTDSDQPKSSERITQSTDGQGQTSAPANLDPAVAQRAVLYEENPGGGQQFQNFVGSAVWKTEAVTGAGRAPDLGLRIEIEIPERKILVTLKMRRNTDPSFPASHTIEVIFDMPAGDAFGGVADMRGLRAKGGETAQGNPLALEVQKVKEGYFLLALPNVEEDNNLSMLRERDWIDIPFVYANGRRAVLTFQKGTPGERALREVLNSWGKGSASGG